MTKSLERLAGGVLPPVLAALEIASTMLLFVMMALTFVDVIGRYVFTAPIFGANEMIQFLLAMTIFAGLGLINARDDHIVVELFDDRFRRLGPRAYRIVIQTGSIVAMGLITFVLLESALDSMRVGSRTVVLEWPLAIVAGTIAALSVLSLVMQVLGLFAPQVLADAQSSAGAGPGSGPGPGPDSSVVRQDAGSAS